MSTLFYKIFSNRFHPGIILVKSWELLLVIEKTVTISLKVGICHFLLKILADTFGIEGALDAAGAVAAGALQTVLHHLYNVLILVEPDCHFRTPLPCLFLWKTAVPGGTAALAERVGFEPTAGRPVTSFQDWLLKPLGHLSLCGKLYHLQHALSRLEGLRKDYPFYA